MDNDDSSSLYSLSASYDDSETDDGYFNETAPAMENKCIVFKSKLH